jgi:hypothetical protein
MHINITEERIWTHRYIYNAEPAYNLFYLQQAIIYKNNQFIYSKQLFIVRPKEWDISLN